MKELGFCKRGKMLLDRVAYSFWAKLTQLNFKIFSHYFLLLKTLLGQCKHIRTSYILMGSHFSIVRCIVIYKFSSGQHLESFEYITKIWVSLFNFWLLLVFVCICYIGFKSVTRVMQ